MAFTEDFSKGSHIRERCFNLIIPRVPIVFKLENRKHLREIEEVNNIKDCLIRKARWIKPVSGQEVYRPDTCLCHIIYHTYRMH
jgi:hypothetical protein